MLAGPARAEHPAECRVAEQLVESDYPLPQVARAIATKQLNILVVGAGSSLLPGPNGAKNAYPARLQAALAEKLPDVAVKVTDRCAGAAHRGRNGENAWAAFGGGQAGADGLADRHRRCHAVG